MGMSNNNDIKRILNLYFPTELNRIENIPNNNYKIHYKTFQLLFNLPKFSVQKEFINEIFDFLDKNLFLEIILKEFENTPIDFRDKFYYFISKINFNEDLINLPLDIKTFCLKNYKNNFKIEFLNDLCNTNYLSIIKIYTEKYNLFKELENEIFLYPMVS